MEKRTFIAVKIKPEKPLSELISELKSNFSHENFRWVDESMFHITIHFIGNTTFSQVNQVAGILNSKSFNQSVFEIQLQGVDFFGPRSSPKVLIVKAIENVMLNDFVKEIAFELARIGLPGNFKTFSPHLTLARIKSVQNLPLFLKTLGRFNDYYLQSNLISEIIFYESILQPAGAVYKPIQIFKLKQTI